MKKQEILSKIKWVSGKTILYYLAGINRGINPSQVTKLAKSLEKMGIIRPIVCCEIDFINGKKQLYIIDGQHLFNALLRMGWGIPYVIIDVKDKKELVETIALLNSSSKSWTMVDYVNAWSSLKEEYVKLNHYFQVYDMEVSFIAGVLSGNSCDSGSIITKVKNGEFNIQNEKYNVSLLDCLTDILKIIPRMGRIENKYVCREYIKFLRGCNTYNHQKFIKSLEENKKQFLLATQQDGKLYELFKKLT